MKKMWVLAIAIAAALNFPAISRAHEGHSEKVMGTVSSIEGHSLMVKTAAGKTVTVVMNAKTKVTRGKLTVEESAVKVGDRVVATGPDEKGMIMAMAVQLAAAHPAVH